MACRRLVTPMGVPQKVLPAAMTAGLTNSVIGQPAPCRISGCHPISDCHSLSHASHGRTICHNVYTVRQAVIFSSQVGCYCRWTQALLLMPVDRWRQIWHIDCFWWCMGLGLGWGFNIYQYILPRVCRTALIESLGS